MWGPLSFAIRCRISLEVSCEIRCTCPTCDACATSVAMFVVGTHEPRSTHRFAAYFTWHSHSCVQCKKHLRTCSADDDNGACMVGRVVAMGRCMHTGSNKKRTSSLLLLWGRYLKVFLWTASCRYNCSGALLPWRMGRDTGSFWYS